VRDWYYHGTDIDSIPSIATTGLDPAFAGKNCGDWCQPAVYLTRLAHVADHWKPLAGTGVVLAIEASAIRPMLLEPDRNLDPDISQAYEYYASVPPSAIHVLLDGIPIPIASYNRMLANGVVQ